MPEGLFEAKLLYRRLDSLLGALDPARPPRELCQTFLASFVDTLHEDLRLGAAALYTERREGFELLERRGAEAPAPDELAPALPPLALTLRHGVYVFADPEDEAAPHRFGLLARGPVAGLAVGRRPERHVYFFGLVPGWSLDVLDFALNTVRAALGARILEERLRGSVRQAAEIQESLLDDEPPVFPGFEIACRSLPTEEVSGDFYDFLPFGDEMLGLAVGDASGHGLPAALLVRDVVTGLRIGIEKDLKVAHVFWKLNRVIHRSRLSSRFVSVFYGELEPDGNLLYVNAGHQPPLLVRPDSTLELTIGGTVIGPLPEARFRRGFARLDPGCVLVMCTDGLIERRDAAGEFFGVEGLTRVVRRHRKSPAQAILDRVFTAAFDHGEGRPWEDDATLVVVRRPA